MDCFEKLPEALLLWYENHKRPLPWRADRKPYHIWVSEIMLQQTRVEAVKGYYARFMAALPDIEALSRCSDDALHKLWEGLGYYSRVRNLKKTAIIIQEQYGGRFPEEYQKVLALPGIGEYTAGAICSIAFNLPTPAVDGNVLRVAARLTEAKTPIDSPRYRAEVRRALAACYPPEAGAFTQALMELGATLCGPNRSPDCGHCPCQNFCGGFQNGTAERFPVRLPKKEKKLQEKTVLILSCAGRYALSRRPDRGLLAGLWEFPNVEGLLSPEQALEAAEKIGLHPRKLLHTVERQHIFTHIRWRLRGVYLEVQEEAGDFCWMDIGQIDREAALPTAFRQFRDAIL